MPVGTSAIRCVRAMATLFSGLVAGNSAHFLVPPTAVTHRGIFLLETCRRTPCHHLMGRASLPRVKDQRGNARRARHRQAVAWQSRKSRSPESLFSSWVRKLLSLRRTAKEPKGHGGQKVQRSSKAACHRRTRPSITRRSFWFDFFLSF